MENVGALSAPLAVDVSVGEKWGGDAEGWCGIIIQ